MHTAPSTRGPRRHAIADAAVVLAPATPFGLVVGLAISESEMPAWLGQVGSFAVFAGAAQLTMVTLAGVSAWWAVVLAAMVINLRHVMYSVAVAPAFTRQPAWMRFIAPTVLIDQQFALVSQRLDHDPAASRTYYLWAGGTLLVGWQFMTLAGIVVGPTIPTDWRLGFAPAVMFCGLVVIGVKDVANAVAAIVGLTVGLVAIDLRDRLGIVVGAVAGVTAGYLADLLIDRRRAGASAPTSVVQP